MMSMGMTMAILLMMAFAGKSAAFIFFVAVLGFFLYATRPVIQAWAMDTTPRNMAGTTVGFMFGVQAAGSSISPLLGGIIADAYGLFAAFYFLAATIACANLLIFLMPKDEVREAKAAGAA